MSQRGEVFPHVTVNNDAQRGRYLARQRTSIKRPKLPLYDLAYRRFSGAGDAIEGLHLELTFTIYGLVKSEFPCKTVGTGNFADTAMLIPFTTDLHFSSLQAVEFSLLTMVLYGLSCSSGTSQISDS
jgi:hypothetical protein